MVLVHDGPSFAEPHDATIVHRSKINPVHVWKRDDPFFADAVKQAKADGVDLEVGLQGHPRRRQGSGLHDLGRARLWPRKLPGEAGRRGHGLRHQHRRRRGPDARLLHRQLRHQHGDRPQQTSSVTFTADKPGVYWYYCSWFCHAMHMEMQGRMLVEPQND